MANWLKADPVLMDGEMALVATDASKPTVYDSKKVGDGTHKFSELEMLGYKCLEYLSIFTDDTTFNSLIKELYINNAPDNASIRTYKQNEQIYLEVRYDSIVKSKTVISSGSIIKLLGYGNQDIDGYVIFDFDTAQNKLTATPIDAKINSYRTKNLFFSPCIYTYLEYCTSAYVEESVLPILVPLTLQDIDFVHDETIYDLNGELKTFSRWCSTDILKISDFPISEIDILLRDGANAVSFYNSIGTYISGITNPIGTQTATKRITNIDIPDGAVFYAFSRSKSDTYALKTLSQFEKLEGTLDNLSSSIVDVPKIKDTQKQIIADLYTLDSIVTSNLHSTIELTFSLLNRLYFNNDYYPNYTVTSIIIRVPDDSMGGNIKYGLCKKDGSNRYIGTAGVKAGINTIITDFKIGLDEYVFIKPETAFNFSTYGPCNNQKAYMWLLNKNTLEEYNNRSISFDIKVTKLISNIEPLPKLEDIEKNNSTDILYLINGQSKRTNGSISWLAIGDSFTQINDIQSSSFTKGYMTRTVEKIPQLSYKNMGHSGLTFGSTQNNTTYPLEKVDVYTVLFGTNDWDQDINLGTISDFQAKAYNGTILGDFGGLIERLLQIDADAIKKLIVMTPTERGFYSRSLSISFDGSTNNKESYHSSETPNKIGLYLSDIAKGIVQCCEQAKIRYVDLNTKSYISAKNAVHGGYVYKDSAKTEQVFVSNPDYLQYVKDNETLAIRMYQQDCIYTTYDGLHPSDLGFEIISRLLAEEMRKVIF